VKFGDSKWYWSDKQPNWTAAAGQKSRDSRSGLWFTWNDGKKDGLDQSSFNLAEYGTDEGKTWCLVGSNSV
jgi:hypothetical protein